MTWISVSENNNLILTSLPYTPKLHEELRREEANDWIIIIYWSGEKAF